MINYLFIGHLLVSILGAIIGFIYTKSIEATFNTFVCIFFLPVAGAVTVFIYWIFKMRRKDKDVNAGDLLVKDDTDYSFYSDLIVDHEVNVLPLNDILLVSENHTKRERFLATIKKDITRYSSYVKLALSNEDGETSHYAAAVIQETKRKMDAEIIELMREVSKNPSDEELLCDYADFLMSYLTMDLFEAIEKKKFVYEYINTAKKIIEFNREGKYIDYLINLLLDEEEYYMAKNYGTYYLENYEESVDMYLMNMKIYYMIHDRDELNHMLVKLHESNLMYDNEVMNKIKFWTGEYDD